MKKQKLTMLAVDAGLVAVGLIARWLSAVMLQSFPECVFSGGGITCPACGGTRCVRFFFTGRFAEAFQMHPYIFCLIWYLAAALLVLNIGYLADLRRFRKLGRAMVGSYAVIALTVGFAIFGTVRLFVTLP